MRFRHIAALLATLLSTQVAAAPLHAMIVPYVSGLSSPIDIVAAPDGSGRIFVVEKDGAIRIIENGALLPTPFLSLGSDVVLSGGERGLLSFAFHPSYATNGLFYVYYTRAGDGALTIARYTRSAGNPRLANPASASPVLAIPHPTNSNHNGGKLLFGPDGYLYSSHGDGGSGNDPQDNALSLDTLLGKVLRLDVDGGSPYAIPPDNPFVGTSGARPEIFAYGLRNVWRMSFDRATGDLYIGDVGQNAREEIDLIPASSAGGENFGWRIWEGTRCNTDVATSMQCAALVHVAPILEYDHTSSGAGSGPCGGSVTGGYRYRGTAIPALQGRYVFADYCTGRMWTAAPGPGGVWEKTILVDTGMFVSTFSEDASGELLFANASGAVYRLVPEEEAIARLPDLGGDGRADLVWRNGPTGATAVWLMNGTATTSAATILANAQWRVTHAGDFDGDGRADLVWRNDTTGATALWLMNGTAVVASTVLLADPAWTVSHVGDFNGDGRADLLWRNGSTGATAMWLMNGLTTVASATIFNNPDWLVTHVADFNADGRADLVWRQDKTGASALWLMNGTGSTATVTVSTDRNWTITHTGDMNGDGRADLVWRNIVTGQTAAWIMNGVAVTTSAILLGDAAWSVSGLADLSGDGKADVIWRHRSSGAVAVWTMNGTAVTTAAEIFRNEQWRVAQASDFNADGRADLIWRNTTTGAVAMWLMNGTSTLASSLVFTDPAWHVMSLGARP